MRLATPIFNRAEDVAYTSEFGRFRHPDRANLSHIVVSPIEWGRPLIVDDCCVMRSIVEIDGFMEGATLPDLICIANRTADLDACSLVVASDVGCGHERVVLIASV